MHLSLGSLCTVVLACIATRAIAVPLPQLAGEGAACDSIFSSTDTGIGEGVENAEDNTANLISGHTGGGAPAPPAPPGPPGPPAPPRARRQLAGEGAACNSIFSSTDTGIGEGVENAEDNTAATISKGSHAAKQRRQLNRISDGLGAVGDAAGIGAVTGPVDAVGNSVDGTLTNGAANAGAAIGAAEVSTLSGVGNAVP